MHILKANLDKINYYHLSANSHYNAIDFLENNTQYIEFIEWYELSANFYAINLIEQNFNKIKGMFLSLNENPLIINLLKQNKHLIHSNEFLINPAIYEDTYQHAATQYFKDTIFPELISVIWHPSRFYIFEDLGIDI